MEKFRIDEITINLDNLRKPLNSQQRKEMSKKKLYPYYGANNLMDYIDEYIFDEEILCVAEDGGSWGYKEKCSYIVNEKCWVNNHAHILKAKENLNLKYLMYYLNYNDLSNRITGTTRGKLTKSALNSIEVKLPSIEKQKKIVALLEKAQELIDKRKKQIEELNLLVKSKFIEMFGDQNTNSKNLEKVYLKDISELITKGASPNWQGIEYVDDDTQTLFVTSENVREGYIDLSKKKYLMDAFNEKQKRSILNNGDFLINIVGASIGRAAQFNLDIKANINQAVALVRIKKGLVNDKYMLEYLNSPKALQMYKSMQVSVARANLSLQNINDLEILLPPMELQNQFANFVKQVDKLKFEMENSLKELKENFDSLIQKDFKEIKI
ncbi:hypothetical protein GM168_01540 [Clostridium perfringens]|nr:hypothetical protein [Clostridium perfringens]MDK0840497.1 restriction endonuclease subunit S [Clostridium perfringens]